MPPLIPRRDFMRLAAISPAILLASTSTPEEAKAVNGLRILPFREPLTNTYYLMRACQTRSDAANIPCVNPIDKTSIEKLGLTRTGVDQAISGANALQGVSTVGAESLWLWPSMTISSYETAEILASQLRIRRDHIVPEFSFLDARGLGILNGNDDKMTEQMKLNEVMEAVHANDMKNSSWKPMPAEDGTPNDSVEDVFVRVRQLFSKLETQYFAEEIVVIAPDSDPLSIWQAAVMGKDLKEHSLMEFQPGEIRLVKEKVVDAYGEEVEKPFAKTIFKPV